MIAVCSSLIIHARNARTSDPFEFMDSLVFENVNCLRDLSDMLDDGTDSNVGFQCPHESECLGCCDCVSW